MCIQTLSPLVFVLHCKGCENLSSLVAHMVKNLPAMQEVEVQSLGEEHPLENFVVPLEGDRDVGALCGSHQG